MMDGKQQQHERPNDDALSHQPSQGVYGRNQSSGCTPNAPSEERGSAAAELWLHSACGHSDPFPPVDGTVEWTPIVY